MSDMTEDPMKPVVEAVTMFLFAETQGMRSTAADQRAKAHDALDHALNELSKDARRHMRNSRGGGDAG